jgi:hypothetical protein
MLTLTDTQECPVAAEFVDKKGKAARVDGSPVYETSDPNIVTVGPDPEDPTNAFKALVKTGPLDAVSLPTTAQIRCKVDADLGEGVREIIITGDIEVVAGEAIAGSVTFGAPREQPAS